ncbi:AsmA family protein [Daejeonella lutea]|uniref:AsmA-like C-terminal region n=1 Tax=Daejeonella lutea TaxID=572036 RepID=A0A1T5A3T6_9SPHI|nr:AsmA-like C-terminal region-containing protein [Daejeonella lutea]SKB29449.1 AsmA-like C-terminal region [Daejeonella lutea]
MPRWLKLTLKLGAILICLAMILWIGVAAYVYSNKKALLRTVTEQLNESLNGKLTIDRMEPDLIQGFPGISVMLENVLLRDSLWSRHKHDLLKAKNVFIKIDAFSILTGSPTIKDIRVSNGAIYLFTDSSGLRNTDIFRKRDTTNAGGNVGRKRVNRVLLDNVVLTIDDKLKNKLFKFNIDDFIGSLNYTSDGWAGAVSIKSKVESFSFNLNRGSFLKDKMLDMDLKLAYNEENHLLTIPEQQISIDDDEISIGGEFKFAPNASDYKLNIKAPSILYKDALTLLSPHVTRKLKRYGVKNPVNVQASLRGKLKRGGEPFIDVKWIVEDNQLSLAGETITNVSFTGSYSNEWIKGGPRNDPNSVIIFNNMKGNYFDIPFTADSVRITDLRRPVFTGRFKSAFRLTKLNKVLGGSTFDFTAGKADLDLIYKAPFEQNDKGQRFIYGKIHVHDARAIYHPRNLSLNDMQLVMNFRGRDLSIDNIKLRSGSSSLSMNGVVKNFSNLYYSDPEKMLINWQIRSPQINLNEFMVFLGRRKAGGSAAASNRAVQKMSGNLERILAQASMGMNLNVNKVIYKKFVATDVRGAITLKQSGIAINNLSLKQGGGSFNLTGNIDQSARINRFNIDSKINNVNVERLFYAFDNFGQDAITSQNLRGTFFGGTSVSGSMSDNGTIVPRSFRGNVTFDIRNGALVNFEPMKKVGSFAFPNRNFSDIRFTSLKNTLNLQGNKVIIPPMEIRSTVVNIFLDGVYSFTTGTNIAIKIPLRNPGKDIPVASSNIPTKDRDLKGIVINLRALDGENGKVRFRLGKRAPEGYE